MSVRLERVNSEIKKNLAEIFSFGLKHLDFNAMISVTDVAVSPDLKYAKVYISIFGSEELRSKTLKSIVSESAQIRYDLARRLKSMRTVPNLHFELDTSLDYGQNIDKLLSDIKKDGNP